MLNKESARMILMQLVSRSWITSCIMQSIWTFLFALNRIWLSLFAMIGILVCLFNIYIALHDIDTGSWLEFFVMKLPFNIHFAWIIVATLANINIAFTSLIGNASTFLLLYTARLSLFVLGLGGVILSVHFEDPIFSLVFAWASLAISRFEYPPHLVKRFTNKTRKGIQYWAMFISKILVIISICLMIYLIAGMWI